MDQHAESSWPFDQQPNVAAFTLKRIIWSIEGAPPAPVLFVSHDKDDHAWQFLDGNEADTADAAIVSMEEMLRRDPTLREIADLPPGWVAVRASVGQPWSRFRREADDSRSFS